MKKVLRQWKRRRLTISGKISVYKSLASSMLTHILLSLPNPSQELLEEYDKMTADYQNLGFFFLEYPYSLGGLQLHNLLRFSNSLETTWLRRIMATDSGWTTFALAYEIDKCWTLGNGLAEQKKNTIVNTFWKDVITSIIDLRKELRPLTDLDFLCWPLWYDPTIRLPIIKKLQRNNVCMVSDL